MSRVQTGVRIEKGVLKVLKALAEYEEVSLGALLESIVLQSFNGKMPFDEDALATIAELCRVYDLDLETGSEQGAPTLPPRRNAQETEQHSTLAGALDGLSRMLEDDG